MDLDGKLLARSAAAVFVGIAFAMTLVQLREEPAPPRPTRPIAEARESALLPAQLKTCARMGEAALSAPDCLAAWAEKRRRFFDVDRPEDYADDAAERAPPASEPPVATGSGSD